MALSHLVTLSISSLRNLDIEADKNYDRAHRLYDAALLIRCYTQHALRPYIDSEIEIQFVNKGIEFINLPSTDPGSGSDRTIASVRQITALVMLHIGRLVTCDIDYSFTP